MTCHLFNECITFSLLLPLCWGPIRFHYGAESVPGLAFRKHWLFPLLFYSRKSSAQRKSMAFVTQEQIWWFFSLWKKCVWVFLMTSKEARDKNRKQSRQQIESELFHWKRVRNASWHFSFDYLGSSHSAILLERKTSEAWKYRKQKNKLPRSTDITL